MTTASFLPRIAMLTSRLNGGEDIFISQDDLSVSHLDKISELTRKFRESERELLELQNALIKGLRGVSKLDTNGRYTYVNDAYAKTLGCQPSDLIGQSWQPTVFPEDLPIVVKAYEDMRNSGIGEALVRGVKKNNDIFKKIVTLVKYNGGFYCFMNDVSRYSLDNLSSGAKNGGQ